MCYGRWRCLRVVGLSLLSLLCLLLTYGFFFVAYFGFCSENVILFIYYLGCWKTDCNAGFFLGYCCCSMELNINYLGFRLVCWCGQWRMCWRLRYEHWLKRLVRHTICYAMNDFALAFVCKIINKTKRKRKECFFEVDTHKEKMYFDRVSDTTQHNIS